MRPDSDPKVDEIAGRKEWRQPILQKLPITLTAHSKGTLNEGQGGGKGDAGNINLS
jgi:hypothetical protein